MGRRSGSMKLQVRRPWDGERAKRGLACWTTEDSERCISFLLLLLHVTGPVPGFRSRGRQARVGLQPCVPGRARKSGPGPETPAARSSSPPPAIAPTPVPWSRDFLDSDLRLLSWNQPEMALGSPGYFRTTPPRLRRRADFGPGRGQRWQAALQPPASRSSSFWGNPLRSGTDDRPT